MADLWETAAAGPSCSLIHAGNCRDACASNGGCEETSSRMSPFGLAAALDRGVGTRQEDAMARRPNDRLLTLEEAAEVLGTGPRFTRRLVAERRIQFVKVGRHVRIPLGALEEFIAGATVQPMSHHG